MSVAGIILAAGESRRMGSPKALLRYRDETFLDTLIGLFAARCRPVIVVLGAHADEIRDAHAAPRHLRGEPGLPARPDHLHAVRPARRACRRGGRALHPGGSSGRRRLHARCLLLAATASAGARAALPRPARPPHLVLARPHRRISGTARRMARPAISSAPTPPQTEFLDVDDPGILADIDDPAAYRPPHRSIVR